MARVEDESKALAGGKRRRRKRKKINKQQNSILFLNVIKSFSLSFVAPFHPPHHRFPPPESSWLLKQISVRFDFFFQSKLLSFPPLHTVSTFLSCRRDIIGNRFRFDSPRCSNYRGLKKIFESVLCRRHRTFLCCQR
jgi:hypothetical protein